LYPLKKDLNIADHQSIVVTKFPKKDERDIILTRPRSMYIHQHKKKIAFSKQ